ncbi:diguanylate cyclase [Candidatus Bipolaricaulota bacterium]|nr:diguanylate cyclase [Candidatus Bipolaricaulota bacterium]
MREDKNPDERVVDLSTEERFQQLFGSMADAAYLIQSNSASILDCNEAAEKQTGYSKAELVDKDIEKILQVQNTDIVTSIVNKKISARESVRFIDRKRRKDGTLYWDEVVLIPFHNGSEPVHISINRDVSDRADREATLRESEVRYRSIFESTTDAVLIFDRNGVIVEANPNAYQMYGYEPGKLIGVPADQVIHADYFHGFTNFRTAIDDSGHFRARSVNLRKDGTPFDVEVHGGRFSYRGGPHLLSIVRDIREQIAAENHLEAARQKVERLHTAASKLAEAITVQGIYRLAVESAQEILEFSYCTLIMIEGDNFIIKEASDGLPSYGERIVPINESSVAADTHTSGQTIVFGSQKEVPNARSTLEDFKSGMSAPIESVGVFQVLSRQPNAFSEQDVRLLELLVRHTAQAIERIRLQDILVMQANHDPLTGVYNRRYFNQVIEQELARSKRHKRTIGFLMMDVNRFKEINDTFGHQIGDEVLKVVATLLQDTIRESDLVIRYGGDEFLIVLMETEGESGQIEDRIKAAFARRNMTNELVEFPVTLAIGSANWHPADTQSIEEVLAEADQRMYVTKRQQNGN